MEEGNVSICQAREAKGCRLTRHHLRLTNAETQVREQLLVGGDAFPSAVADRWCDNPTPGVGEGTVRLFEIVKCNANLAKTVATLDAATCFSRYLNGRQQERHQYGDSRNDNEQFNDRRSPSGNRLHTTPCCAFTGVGTVSQYSLGTLLGGWLARMLRAGGCSASSVHVAVRNSISDAANGVERNDCISSVCLTNGARAWLAIEWLARWAFASAL
ncbi:hypothetical protein Pan216_35160 [Planctomycetes bacterium Pan216]|uniref:Uncharacterized protein n=1 Tax=Kolteria novifilia TaxID=2527975 RepID=A0A518B6P2_9BACT|nr:hypothetical protein Pan216_35160 [Planctomycetes bacterium Pan216]